MDKAMHHLSPKTGFTDIDLLENVSNEYVIRLLHCNRV